MYTCIHVRLGIVCFPQLNPLTTEGICIRPNPGFDRIWKFNLWWGLRQVPSDLYKWMQWLQLTYVEAYIYLKSTKTGLAFWGLITKCRVGLDIELNDAIRLKNKEMGCGCEIIKSNVVWHSTGLYIGFWPIPGFCRFWMFQLWWAIIQFFKTVWIQTIIFQDFTSYLVTFYPYICQRMLISQK